MSLSCTALYCVWSVNADLRGTAIPYRCGFSEITLCFSSLIRAPRDPREMIRENGEKSKGENWISLLHPMPKRHKDLVKIDTNCLNSHQLTPPVWVCLKASDDSGWPLHTQETSVPQTLQAESLQVCCVDPYDLTGNFSSDLLKSSGIQRGKDFEQYVLENNCNKISWNGEMFVRAAQNVRLKRKYNDSWSEVKINNRQVSVESPLWCLDSCLLAFFFSDRIRLHMYY